MVDDYEETKRMLQTMIYEQCVLHKFITSERRFFVVSKKSMEVAMWR